MAFALLKKLCTPSYVYLVISIIFLIVSSMQNFGNVNTYCLGDYSCDVQNTTIIFLVKILYIAFWTWILNLMCKEGSTGTSIAWFLVLIPFILMFLLLGMMVLNR
jgi:hypothetical protein|tara:strand:+ start:444 stop:758 length:315 start_codon:yes stop_codon:yes gene_type:complete